MTNSSKMTDLDRLLVALRRLDALLQVSRAAGVYETPCTGWRVRNAVR